MTPKRLSKAQTTAMILLTDQWQFPHAIGRAISERTLDSLVKIGVAEVRAFGASGKQYRLKS